MLQNLVMNRLHASSTGENRGYVYRPETDTGSNEFKRFGPDLDEKSDSFKYYTN
jgi:hypothetical protein